MTDTVSHTDAIPGYIREAHAMGPKIVALGGGTGLSTMLRGLKAVSSNITAIVAVSDDGGSSGYLRHDRSMPPPGDIRNCIMALANTEPFMEQLMNYRFDGGALGGHSFGNLLLAALNGISPSFEDAVARMHEVLAVTGRVMPVTASDVYLEAEFENGAKVLGESKIFNFKKQQGCRIRCVRMVPQNPPALPAALEAITGADMIVVGPGSLYTSVIPNLLVDGVAGAILDSKALKVYVCNVMTQEGESEGYTVHDHVKELAAHSHPNLVQYCLINSSPVPEAILERYEVENAWPIEVDYDALKDDGVELVVRPLLGKQANYARHNPKRLAYELFALFAEKAPRSGELAQLDKMMLSWLRSQL
ncbi:MAG: YvcK family protein [Oscillospiraceae bacterium]|nr:YvcK family protein [Oscillospiraceae bacterium]